MSWIFPTAFSLINFCSSHKVYLVYYSLIILEQNVQSYLFVFLYYNEKYCCLFCGVVIPVKTAKLISASV